MGGSIYIIFSLVAVYIGGMQLSGGNLLGGALLICLAYRTLVWEDPYKGAYKDISFAVFMGVVIAIWALAFTQTLLKNILN